MYSLKTGCALRAVLCFFSFFLISAAGAVDFSHWTNEEKIGQLLLVGYRSDAQIEKLRPGGIILFSWSMKSATQTHDLIAHIQAFRKTFSSTPLLVATDHEGGKVLRLKKGITNWPDAAAAGTADTYTAFQLGKWMGHELSAIGINMNLAPVLDLGNARSFLENRVWGENSHSVAEKSSAFIKGLLSARVMAVAKHFPGHGGSSQDSHYSTTVIKKNMEDFWKEDLEPFREAIQAGVPAVMTAHVEVPAVDRYPASLSKPFLTGILREKLGFKGLVLSDDLEMGGVKNRLGAEKSVEDLALMSLQAGTDMIMVVWSQEVQKKVKDRLLKALKEGEISETWLNSKVEHILNIKEKYLLSFEDEEFIQNPYWEKNIHSSEAEELSRKISFGAIQWATSNQDTIVSRLKATQAQTWNVYVPSMAAQRVWSHFRPQDRVLVIPRRPGTLELRSYSQNLQKALKEKRPTVVITGPRASSSEEFFGITRQLLADYALVSNHLPGAVLWVHQGLVPVKLKQDTEHFQIGLLTLSGSTVGSMNALTDFVGQNIQAHSILQSSAKSDK